MAIPYDEERAARLFELRCAVCHGSSGDGQGPAATQLEPPPADFTAGVFKYRSTPTGSLPTPEDLYDTLGRGARGTAMPAFGALPERDRWLLVERVRRFSPRFAEEPPGEALAPAAPPATASVARGRVLYVTAGCNLCHGEEGRGDGPSAPTLVDSRGRPLPPNNLRRPAGFRAGNRSEDLYRIMATGMDGSPMPSYAEALSAEELWDVVAFVRSLAPPPRTLP